MSLYARLAAALLIALSLAGLWWKVDRVLAAREQRGYDRAQGEQRDRALAEQEAKAKEGLRRLEVQDANQRTQDRELAVAKDAAARNAADADRVREQAAGAAREWTARLADSPSREDLSAAAGAIGVLSDVLGRADRRAGVLASYADTARAAGLKCERDYDALTRPTQ